MRNRLTYANVVATLALFIAVGGASAFAASQLGKNSVGSKQLKANSVTTSKLKKGAVTGAKIKLSSLGTVPSATLAKTADNASTAANANALGGVGAIHYLTADSTLQSGTTEVGIWATSAPKGSYGGVALNFVPHLSGPVPPTNEIFLGEGSTGAHCPGHRKAEAGYLCVYTTYANAMTFNQFLGGFSGTAPVPADPEGTIFYMGSTQETGNARGNWAYTAP